MASTPNDRDPWSCELWELDFRRELPWAFEGTSVRVEWGSLEATLEFVRSHYANIFGATPKDDRFLPDPMSPAKLRFLAGSDRLVFRDDDRTVGVLTGNPYDWSTYYWRTVAFVPEYQGQGLLAKCLERTDGLMREAGIERIEGEASPTNYRQVRLLHRLGYCVTGQTNSERWGTMLRLTKHLSDLGKTQFANQFIKSIPLTRPDTAHFNRSSS